MAKLSSNLFGRLIDIVPLEDTYFIKKEVPNVKLSKDIVKLNYGFLSPFKNGDVIFYKDKQNLYMWFTKNKINSKKPCLPEGFLICKEHLSKESILIKNIGENVYGVVVIKDNSIAAQFVTKKTIDSGFVEILKKEYSLKTPSLTKLDSDEISYHASIKDILKFLSSFNIDLKRILLSVYEEMKIPVIVLLFLLNTLDIFMYRYVSKTIQEKKVELNRLITLNKTVKKKFTILEKESNFFNTLIKNELSYPNLYSTISVVFNCVYKDKGIVKMYKQYNNIADIQVVASSISSIVNSLMSTGYFNDVQVLNVSQYYYNKKKEVGRLELDIKEIKNGG